MKPLLKLAPRIIGAAILLILQGCAHIRYSEREDAFSAIAEQLQSAHKKLSLLRDSYEQEHPKIRAQWEIIAALEREWIREEEKASKSLVVIDRGAPWTPEIRYTLADNHLLVENRGPRERKSKGDSDGTTYVETGKLQCYVLDAKAAKEIWEKIERLRITEWKSKYSPEDLKMTVADGTRWGVYLRVGETEIQSVGNNVYPSHSPLGAPELLSHKDGKRIANAYTDLLAILESFAQRPNK